MVYNNGNTTKERIPIFTTGQMLHGNADVDNAMYIGIPVTVYKKGRLIDFGGPIKKHTDEAIYIHDGYFLKSDYEFIIR